LALSIIPEQWVAREPAAIAADLADLLIGSLELDFAFVRLCDKAAMHSPVDIHDPCLRDAVPFRACELAASSARVVCRSGR
jgi:hypothetical protein